MIDNAFDFAMYGNAATLAGEFLAIGNAAPSATHIRRSAASLLLDALSEVRYAYAVSGQGKGASYAAYVSELPTNENSMVLAEFQDDGGNGQVGVAVTPSGRVRCYRGDGTGAAGTTQIGISDRSVITAAGFNYIEVFAFCDASDGAVEVRVNGVTCLNLAGANTVGVGATPDVIAVVAIGPVGLAITGWKNTWLTDLIYWDKSGAYNNDFLGDKYVGASLPNADTATADMVPATGLVGYVMVNNVPPQDGLKYLTAAAVADASAFGMTNLPGEAVSVAAVVMKARASKTSVGTNKIRISARQGVSQADGAEQAVSSSFRYYHTVFETDPATSAPWSVAGVNSAEILLTRTV